MSRSPDSILPLLRKGAYVVVGDGSSTAAIPLQSGVQTPLADPEDDLSEAALVFGHGEAQRVGTFRFFLDGQRWEWSDAVARMHGYEPDTVVPSTELLLQHKHPDDRPHVAAALDRVLLGDPFSSRHRIIDTSGRTHWVIVVSERSFDDNGAVIGTSGFYIDVTESFQSDVTTVVSEIAESRAQIEQAKGVLMAAYGISAERAFDILVWRSQEMNIKLREVAARFLAALAGRLSSDSVSQIDHALLTLE